MIPPKITGIKAYWVRTKAFFKALLTTLKLSAFDLWVNDLTRYEHFVILYRFETIDTQKHYTTEEVIGIIRKEKKKGL